MCIPVTVASGDVVRGVNVLKRNIEKEWIVFLTLSSLLIIIITSFFFGSTRILQTVEVIEKGHDVTVDELGRAGAVGREVSFAVRKPVVPTVIFAFTYIFISISENEMIFN